MWSLICIGCLAGIGCVCCDRYTYRLAKKYIDMLVAQEDNGPPYHCEALTYEEHLEVVKTKAPFYFSLQQKIIARWIYKMDQKI